MIVTYGQGRPLEAPVLPANPSPQEVTEWLRAYAAHNDRVTAIANRAFDTTFRKAVRGVR